MGGFNSGRKTGKDTTQGRNTLDVRKWQRDGLLKPGYRFDSSWTRNGKPNGSISVIVNESGVHLIYRHGGDTGQDMNYPVPIAWTPCNYGGRRAWWLCPCCGKRVAILYSGKMFACRHCLQLAYQSDREAKDDKPYRRGEKVRRELGWGGGVVGPLGDKPKGMHWKTFDRHLQKLELHAIAANQSFARTMARLPAAWGLKDIAVHLSGAA